MTDGTLIRSRGVRRADLVDDQGDDLGGPTVPTASDPFGPWSFASAPARGWGRDGLTPADDLARSAALARWEREHGPTLRAPARTAAGRRAHAVAERALEAAEATRAHGEHRCPEHPASGPWRVAQECVTWTDPDGIDRVAHVPAAISGPGTMAMMRTVDRRAEAEREAARLRRDRARAAWREAARLAESGARTPVVRAAAKRAEVIESERTETPRVAAHRGGPTRHGVTVVPDPAIKVRTMADGPMTRAPAGRGAVVYRYDPETMSPADAVAAVESGALLPRRLVGALGGTVARGAAAYVVEHRGQVLTAPGASGGRLPQDRGPIGAPRPRPVSAPQPKRAKRQTRADLLARARAKAAASVALAEGPALIG